MFVLFRLNHVFLFDFPVQGRLLELCWPCDQCRYPLRYETSIHGSGEAGYHKAQANISLHRLWEDRPLSHPGFPHYNSFYLFPPVLKELLCDWSEWLRVAYDKLDHIPLVLGGSHPFFSHPKRKLNCAIWTAQRWCFLCKNFVVSFKFQVLMVFTTVVYVLNNELLYLLRNNVPIYFLFLWHAWLGKVKAITTSIFLPVVVIFAQEKGKGFFYFLFGQPLYYLNWWRFASVKLVSAIKSCHCNSPVITSSISRLASLCDVTLSLWPK